MNRRIRRALWALAALVALAGDSLLTRRLTAREMAARATEASAGARAAPDPLSEFRLEREQLRARQSAQLNDIIHSGQDDGEAVAMARRQLIDMTARAEAEATIEGVLRARGFEDAIVTVSAQSANVLVRREATTQRETAVILDLVMRETGLTGGNVKIIPVK